MTEQQTFIALKPDAIQRKLVGQILTRFEDEDITIQQLKTVEVGDNLLALHYNEHVDEPYYPGLVEYMQERPVITAILQGENVVERVRALLGDTDPAEAENGTIRGDLGADSFDDADEEGRAVRNLVHASASQEEAKREIELWYEKTDN